MITIKELNSKGFLLDEIQSANLDKLLIAINIVRAAWAKPMFVTSGFRSLSDHRRIYAEIAKAKGLKAVRIPMGSRHLSGEAVDILDLDGSLYKWAKANEPVLIKAGLWCEDDPKTPRVHFQITPPRSGKRWFLP